MKGIRRSRRNAWLVLVGLLVVTGSAVGVAAAVGGGPEQPVSDLGPVDPSQSPGSSVTGTVTDAAGTALAGVVIHATPLPGSPPVPDVVVTTDETGSYRWSLPPGEYQLVASTVEASSAPVTVAVPPEGTEADLQVDG